VECVWGASWFVSFSKHQPFIIEEAATGTATMPVFRQLTIYHFCASQPALVFDSTTDNNVATER
jgi:hypothetical protein